LLAGRSAVEGAEGVTEGLNRRAAGALLIGVATMFGLLWLAQIATVATTGVLPPDLAKAGISSNPVYALDLAFFLPLCAIAGIGLLRRSAAAAFAFPMLVWVPLMGAGVVGGIVLMAAAGDQTAVPVAVVITLLAAASAILAAVAVVRPRRVRSREFSSSLRRMDAAMGRARHLSLNEVVSAQHTNDRPRNARPVAGEEK
jgi:cytochrome bd-type quinol oxidase subunit 2